MSTNQKSIFRKKRERKETFKIETFSAHSLKKRILKFVSNGFKINAQDRFMLSSALQENCKWLANAVSEHMRKKEETLACLEKAVKKQMAKTTRTNELLACVRSFEDYSRAQDNACEKEPDDPCQKQRDCSGSETAATDVCHGRAADSHQNLCAKGAENSELEEKLKTGRSWHVEVL